MSTNPNPQQALQLIDAPTLDAVVDVITIHHPHQDIILTYCELLEDLSDEDTLYQELIVREIDIQQLKVGLDRLAEQADVCAYVMAILNTQDYLAQFSTAEIEWEQDTIRAVLYTVLNLTTIQEIFGLGDD